MTRPDLNGLSADEKRALLARILKAKTVRGDTFPLSFQQQRLWFLDQMDPGNVAYNVPAAYRLRGTLDPDALAQSLSQIVRRHEALRTRFELRDGAPVQVVAPAEAVALEVEDLRGRPDAEGEMEAVAHEEAARPFDLATGPLLRVRLLRMAEDEHVLVIVMHHVVSDGWSMGIFFRELAALYGARVTGHEPPLADLATQYPDYAVWQREQLTEARVAQEVAFWRERLAGAPAVLELPTDRPRPAVATFRGARELDIVPPHVVERAKALARSEGSTLYMVLMTAFQAVLSRWSGQDDVVVGSPVAGRTRKQTEELIGFFVNTLVLRADFGDGPTFRDALARVREATLGAFAHQELPFEKLVEELQPERSLSHSPIFQALFALQNLGDTTLHLAGVTAEPLPTALGGSKNDLSIYAVETGEGLRCSLIYNPDLWDAATMRRLLAHFRTLLADAVADPSTRVADLALLDETERSLVVGRWNATGKPWPSDACVHEVIAAQARRTPDATALVFRGTELTYAQLDAEANRLANHLRRRGVRPETRVGICLERSAETVVAMLAVMKAGGAYLPLDPAYPADRLAYMLEDSGAPVLVTQKSLRSLLAPGESVSTVMIDADAEAIDAESDAAPVSGAVPLNTAYVIYTSGSTGKPKGVQVTHANAVSFFAGMDDRVGGPVPGTWLAVTRTSFDIHVLELLWTLARGFRVVVQPEQAAAPAPRVRRSTRPMDFSLFYFSSGGHEGARDKYRLLLDGARFADTHGFSAVWTPERHFHAFGGAFPNPSVVGAAVAAITRNVGIRAGSVVLPLHDPVRVAEEWSVVDNLSNGRVGISIASGWQPNDFVLKPENYADRKNLMFQGIETVRSLWKGESLTRANGVGKETTFRILPRPVQPEIPVWVTAGGSPDTFRMAGEAGASLLTHLLGQSVDELAEKVRIYREAYRASGAAGDGHVSLMIHTFVGEDVETVRATVRDPFRAYLATSLDLIKPLAQARGIELTNGRASSDDDMNALLDHAFERYWQTSGLMGTPETCAAMIERLKAAGVDEVACLIDFVDDVDTVLAALPMLDVVRREANAAAEEPQPAAAVEEVREDERIAAQIERYDVTHLQCTPSLAGLLLAEEGPGALQPLKRILLGGEALPPELAREIARAVPGALVNVYGPTETTVWSATHAVDEVAGTVPIGTPIANTRVYVLDGRLRPQPVGVPGELYIAGAGVTRGYLHRPGLTAERFLPEPHGDQPGGRMYRTGDLVKWRADGTLEYIGRADFQVKVRGFRIELGEIEAALKAHPGVADAVVAAREDGAGGLRLVGYTIAAAGQTVSAEALRAKLSETLPEYMVPGAFVALDAFPLTPNGKLDRRALPAPDLAASAPEYVAPRGETEQRLAEIWSQVLRAERVGAHDNFFSLGGHSLMAMRVIARIRQVMETELPLRAVFEAPTVAQLAARIDAQAPTADNQPIPRRADTESDPPLSFQQQRLWVLDQLEPESPVYHMPYALRMRGALDADALEKALAALWARHEGLRTAFVMTEDGPVQRIAGPDGFTLPRTDLSHTVEPETEARRLAAEDAVTLFDLARGPLWRVRLLRLSADDHVLLMNMHHVASDGWSMNVIRREMLAAYESFAAGRAPAWAPLAVQYADYAAWQRTLLADGTAERQLGYWRTRLAGAPPVLELPTDRPRPGTQSHRGAWASALLPPELAGALNELSRREGATLYMTLLAGFKSLVARYAGISDVVIGTPIAGRPRPELEGIVGFFVNALALRTDLSGDPAFREVLARVRETTLGAYAHQDVPFEQVVEALQPVRSLAHAPLYQVMFNLLNLEQSRNEVAGLQMESLNRHLEIGAKFDMTLYAQEREDGLHLELLYATDLFDSARMRELLRHYTTLLRAIASDAELRLSAVPLATDDELRAMRSRGNTVSVTREFGEFAAEEIDQTIHRRFAAAVAAHAERPAIRTPRHAWTYAQLDAASDRAARAVVASAGAGERVALLFEHDAPMVAGMLGALKAGKTYVPLDPQYPRERVSYILSDSGATMLLTNDRNLALAQELAGGDVPVVSVDSADLPEVSIPVDAGTPDAPAYILYTSGSTGQPKGVVQSHRNVLHHIRAYTNALHLSADDRLSLFSSYTFDASVMDIYGALLNGALLAPFDWKDDSALDLPGWVREEGITVFHSTPTVYRQLIGSLAETEVLNSVRLVVLGGEEAQRRDVDLFRRHFTADAIFVNGLGPTESTLALQYFIDRNTAVERSSLPVGYPVADTDVRLMTPVGEQVAVYGAGEIAIRSRHVAMGYWGRQDLTDAAFMVEGDGTRTYRTGDLGRRLANGEIEYLGRKDFQVKIRGHRVEIGEIEVRIRRHDEIEESVVVARQDARGDNRLIAYVVPRSMDDAPSAAELREHVRGGLPEYMVPAAFVALDALPLTPNGKVDRRALPEPELLDARAGGAQPRTPTEEVLAGIWAEVLGLETVGRDDAFFELGGHSLLATRVMARVEQAFGVKLPLRAIFEHGTVAGLAERIDTAEAGDARPPVVPVRRDGPLPLSFAQQRLWFLWEMEPESASYNMPYALRLRGALDADALERALTGLVARHESLRTRFMNVDGRPVQTFDAPAPLPLPVDDIRHLPQAERTAEGRRRAREEARRPFDLIRGPVVRARLVRMADDEHLLLVTVHHIVSDGWSLGVIFRELGALYQAFRDGEASPLAPLPVQYGDFAAWQHAHLEGEVLARQVDFWRGHLSGAPALLELPTDRPRPATQSLKGATYRFRIPGEVRDGVRALARREGSTVYMAMLAALQALLARYTGTEDIVVGSPVAGRTRQELEGLIGFFVNMLPMRADLSGDPGFSELLRRVRGSALAAYAHQDLPFERLVEELRVERDPSRSPVFQVMFTLNEPRVMEFPGLEVDMLAAGTSTAKFDLMLFAWDTGDGFSCAWEYATDLFEPGTIERLAGHFATLLAGAVAEPDRAVSALPILTEEERRQVVDGWNRQGASAGTTLHAAIEDQAARTPSAVALSFEGRTMTYNELNRRANQLAHRLRRHGVGPEVRVGICMERSPEMVIALLGTLKAGGAYVPMDPEYPRDRLAYMLSDAAVPVLLTQSRLLETIPEHAAATIVLDEELEAISGEPENAPGGPVTPAHLAYMIYTSGSTGRPKGAMNAHRGVVNRLVWMQDEYNLTAGDVVLQKTPFSFDVSVWEFFWPLMTGARLVLAKPGGHRDPVYLAELIQREGVTTLHFVPSMLSAFVDAAPAERCGTLARVVCSGEALPAELVERFYGWMHAAGNERVGLHNLYGPTEAAVDVTYWPCERGARPASIPIGRPVANTRIYVLDARGNPVPTGAVGELHIGGVQVGRGYLGRPSLTAEKFVPDAFGAEPGMRLYRTGDRARWRADGALEYLGRIDFQVKLRGFRIELGEIESALRTHPQVADAVVDVREDGRGEPRLVGYVIPAAEAAEGDEGTARVEQWQSVFDDIYTAPATAGDETFNIEGWNSSYTGEPIPADEMREWVERAAERIVSLHPRRVLELGVGSGLLLFRVAPYAARYHGTDLSPNAIRSLTAAVQHHGDALPPVALQVRGADDFGGMEAGQFDTVALNSVAQYFPGAEYLAGVVRGAVRVLADGGTFFLGDLRGLPTLAAFHAALELGRADDEVSVAELRDRIHRRGADEEELVIDPAFFAALARELDRVTRVEVLLKRARYHNEMSRHRYDVVLRVGAAEDVAEAAVVPFAGMEGLRSALAEREGGAVAFTGIPNARVALEVRALALIEGADPAATAAGVRAALEQDAGDAVDPEALWALGETLGIQVDLRPTPGQPGAMDALFRPAGVDASFPPVPADRPLRELVNDPKRGSRARRLVPLLKGALRESLPEYMVPTAFVVMDAFPLSANGKLDRRALPQPEAESVQGEYVAPRTPAEEVLAAAWAELLGVDRVGAQDDFFELGGHSLLATRVVSRVRELFGVELPLRAVFEAPTVARLAARIAEMETGGTLPAIEPADRDAPLPLSFAQQRLWFVDQLEPGTPVYNVPAALRMRGTVDVPALERAIATVVARHESLRTVFAAEGDRPVQVIRPADEFRLGVEDLSALSGDAREAEIRRFVAAESRAPFDLRQGPLFRARLVRLADDDHVLTMTTHHIVSDGWSMGVLFRELSAAYAAHLRGEAPALEPLPVQYADFAAWQRQHLTDDVITRQMDFWRRRLSDAPAVLELPTDHPRPAVQTHAGGREAALLPPELLNELRALARREGATLYMVLLAAWQLLLSRYADQDDVVVGSPIAGRTAAETEGLIGFFVNTLVLRTRLDGDPTFRQLLGRVREATLGAYAHQDVPFERLVSELQPERSLSRSALFQVMFVLQNAGAGRPVLPGVEVRGVEAGSWVAKFDLTLSMMETERGLTATMDYAADLFDASTIQGMLAHLKVVLQAVAGAPGTRLSDLPLLTPGERERVLVEWNHTSAALPTTCIHDLFAAQAARTPEAPAVISDDATVSYGELDLASSRLARYLRALGVGPETRVGVLFDRAEQAVAPVLGVLKAGGAYVPFATSTPRERLADALEDSGIRVVVTTEEHAGAVPPGVRAVRVDADAAAIVAAGDEPVHAPVDGDALAYVIYTSGSTGRPKGVMVHHGAVANLTQAFIRAHGFHAHHRILVIPPLFFDASVGDIFPALAVGAAVVFHPDPSQLNAAELLRFSTRHGITAVDTAAALWKTWTDELTATGRGIGNAPLELMMVGAETIPMDTARAWRAATGGKVRLVNHYGPTETTVCATVHFDPEQPEEARSASFPIGRPLANARAYVLDAALHPVGVGAYGELYIGGAGVARGYHQRPSLTAGAFVPDPFSGHAGARMYRTGDRVRWLADGALEFVGRTDHQLKVRGYRIEAGEVEAALRTHPAVRDALVLARDDAPGGRRLVAYVTPSDGALPAEAELRGHLSALLPEYMVPAAVVALDAFPVTPNGKVDRRALPAPQYAGDEGAYVAPRTPLERVLAGMWSELLGVARVGMDDDFFALGGHSLLATQMAARVLQTFGVEMPLRYVFDRSTVAGLAQALAGNPDIGPRVERVAEILALLAEVSEDEAEHLLTQTNPSQDV
jgi:natural product biosynthesis luciferase-like monooxygenase protein/amino acid adenylation domain-containing protein